MRTLFYPLLSSFIVCKADPCKMELFYSILLDNFVLMVVLPCQGFMFFGTLEED